MSRERIIHEWTLRAGLRLFLLFLVLSVVLRQGMPERYPVRFDAGMEPTRWAEGPGMWILLVALCSFSFGKGYLFQRWVLTDPDTQLLNVPHKQLFHRLPRERRIPVVRRAHRLLGLCNVGLVLLFILILLLTYHGSRHPDGVAFAVARWSFWIVVASMTLVPLAEAWALSRMVKRKLVEEGLL